MNESDLEKFKAELLEFEDTEPMPIELNHLAAIAIISHIQVAVRHPKVNDSQGLTRMAIDIARQLQEVFDPESATYKVLEEGWGAEQDRPFPETICGEPCKDFLQNRGCRCTNYKIAEVVSGEDNIPPEVLARGAAIMEQVKQRLAGQGFKVLIMDEFFDG